MVTGIDGPTFSSKAGDPCPLIALTALSSLHRFFNVLFFRLATCGE